MSDESDQPAAPAASREQDRVNQQIYHASDIAKSYQSRSLSDAETAALLKYQPTFAQRDVLDLGVGTGRTTWYLAPLARRYIGIDYSPAMVDHLRAALPGTDVRPADMRDLSEFGDGSFDFVLGACNVIDAVSHEDRQRVLHEARRVLRPRGIFMFSSHNRSLSTAQRGPQLLRSQNPATQAKHIAVYFRRLINHAKVRKLRRFEAEYALLNDAGHDYRLLHYYVDRDTQRKQLERTGFRLLNVFSAAGRVLAESEVDTQSSSLLYVCERS